MIDKNPYIWSNGSKKISSQTVNVALKNNHEQDINLPLSLKFENRGTPTSKVIQPIFLEGDRNRMAYLRTKYPDTNDVMIFYIGPTLDNVLYHVYFRTDDFPTTSIYDHKQITTMEDWTEFGLKYFIPGGLFPDGYLYLGIQPDIGI